MTDYRTAIFSGTRRNSLRLRELVEYELRYEHGLSEDLGWRLFVAVGDCPTGVDGYVRGWCAKNMPRADWRVYEADWRQHGPAAGPLRNRDMCRAHSDAERLIAFPASWDRELSKGTWDCVDAATEFGIGHRVVAPEEWA